MSYEGHEEHHLMHRSNWLRAAVLGSNDGILSTASLLAGVAAASAGRADLLLVGVAALIAGAMSMAAGEYVSVSSQADTERADLAKEKRALKEMPEEELRELADIYEQRGVEPKTALAVARQLTEHDALDAHARDEIGISPVVTAQPLQAAVSSALSFAVGALLPLIAAMLAPAGWVVFTVIAASLASLALLGLFSAQMSGAGATRAVLRVVIWGAAAMVATSLVGHLFGANVAAV